MDESQSQQPWEIAQTEPLLNHPNNNNDDGRESLDSNRSSLDPNDTTLPLSPNTQAQLNDMASRASSNTGDNTANNSSTANSNNANSTSANNNNKMSNEDELNRLLKLLSPTTTSNTANTQLNEEDGAALLSYLTKLRTGNSTSDAMEVDQEGSTNEDSNNGSSDQNNNGACEQPIKWSANNVQLVKLTVKSVMNSFNNSSGVVASTSSSISVTNGGASSNGTEEGVTTNNNNTVTIDNKLALRLLSEGILPFSGVNTNNSGGGGAVSNNGEGGNEGTWVAKLIQSIVMEDLLPTALLSTESSLTTEGSVSENASEGDGGTNSSSSSSTRKESNNIDTTALSILLSAFLTRMDSDEMLQILPPSTANNTSGEDDQSAFGSVDDILDRLCGVLTKSSSGGSAREGRKEIVRPSSAAAVLASLIEFENNASSTVGGGSNGSRLSRKRIWKRTTSSVISSTTSNNNQQGLSQRRKKGRSRASLPTSQQQNQQQLVNYEAQYVYIDRPTYLISTCLVCLTKLCGGKSSNEDDVDYDLIPSLVYQLGLLPMNTVSRSNNSGGSGSNMVAQTKGGDKKKKVKKENDKQRGLRLRRMILEGIATILDDDDNIVNSSGNESGGILLAASSSSNNNNTKKNSLETKEAYKWAKYTSLEHLGRVLRTDPDMSKAVLSLLSGDIVDTTSFTTSDDGDDDGADNKTKNQKPFRYSRLTPFTLAMSLSMASAVPRMRTPTLSAIRDLIVEEQTIRIKRGLDVNGNVIGMGRPWLNCLVQSLDGSAPSSAATRNSTPQKQNENGIGHVLTCLLSVAKFAEGENSGVGMSSLLQSLSTLGYLLVDCVKKDELSSLSTLPSFTSDGSLAMQPTPVLASNLDISSFNPNNNNNKNNVDTSAPHATSVIGRFLLSYLYYQGAKNSSHFTSSSLASMSTIGGGGGSSSSDNGGTGLCRSILRTSFDKFCGMSPNAYEHSLLLQDLLKFSPVSLNHLFKDDNDDSNNDNMMGGMDGLDDEQKQMVISFNLTSNHLPALIDTLANVPGGAMHPTVASQVIVPTIGRLLFLMATSRIGLGTLWKRHDLEDHVNHAFLLCKKALFAPDVEKRKCAANLLVMLLGVATVASTSTSSSSSRSVWSSMLYDMKGCLRRCLSNHQNVVRMEAYSSLVALLPKTMPSNGDMSLSAASQDSASPASSTASSPLSAASSTITSSWNTIVQSIPSSGQHAIVCIVSELLLSSLERYVTIPKEEFTDRNARRQRSAMGVGLSQMEMVMEEESSPVQKGDNDDEEMSNPFRFDKCISTRPSAANTQSSSGKKKTKNTPIGQSLLTEALKRINEPLPFLWYT